MEKNLICIRCPRGCELKVIFDENKNIKEITGNSCKLGISYAEDEIKNPVRIVTTTVKVEGGNYPLCPVWTEKPVPKDKIFELLSELKKIKVKAPVSINQIILENFLNLSINIVATRNIEKGKKNE